jgi:hypothetical protein
METYVQTSKEFERAGKCKPRSSRFADSQCTTSGFVAAKVKDGYENGLSVLEACESWYSCACLSNVQGTAQITGHK